jgi:hypothetical protein
MQLPLSSPDQSHRHEEPKVVAVLTSSSMESLLNLLVKAFCPLELRPELIREYSWEKEAKLFQRGRGG